MSKNAKPAATKPAEVAAAPAAVGNKKMIIIVAVVVAALAGGGGWFFARGKHDAPHAEEVKVEAPKKALFATLEAFTVNLQKETSDQYLQVGMTLKYFEPELDEKIKANLPEIRSRILLLLATKKASELATPEGKNLLIEEVRNMTNQVLGFATRPASVASAASAPHGTAVAGDHNAAASATVAHAVAPAAEANKGIVDILFTSFIIQ